MHPFRRRRPRRGRQLPHRRLGRRPSLAVRDRRSRPDSMSIDVTTDLQHAGEDAAAHLYVWALKDIPQDLRGALAAARPWDAGFPGRGVFETIHRNINVADSEENLVCPVTGIAVYHAKVGE